MEESESRLSEVNEGRGEFPMVLGRSLNKLSGMKESGNELIAKPSESYDMIRHDLIVSELGEQVKEVKNTHSLLITEHI